MKKEKTRIFLTGATGVMGQAALKELMAYETDFEVIVLARPSKKNQKKLKGFIDRGLKVIWGDLLDRSKVRQGVEEADIVLHVGGMVSPMAEHFPEKTLKTNVESIRIITEEVKRIEDAEPDRVIKVVYIGSVSQYGSRMEPNHWGKVGDPLKAAKFDAYAVSKILAERVLVESGIKKWVSLRQTGILHPGILNKANDPVAFHVPVNGVLEWVTTEDSGRLLERVSRDDVPEDFWRNYYNVGGGEKFRLTNFEFEEGILKGLNCPAPRKVFEPNWFALDNFHGMWFEDSDYLEEILHFRGNDSFEECIERMSSELPFYFKLTPIVPSIVIKTFMKGVARKKGLGPLSWIKGNEIERIEAAWGSKEAYEKITGWDNFEISHPSKKITKNPTVKGPLDTTLKKTTCSRGHEYNTSEALETGGHGCPHCLFIDSKVNCPKK